MKPSQRFIVDALVCGSMLFMPLQSAGESQTVYDLTSLRPPGAVFDMEINADQLIFPDHVLRALLVLDRDLNLKHRIDGIETPHHVAVATDGSLYVSTYRDGHILKFDSDFKQVSDWDQQLIEQGLIKAPLAMVVDGLGNLVVTDWLRPAVLKVSPEGALIKEFDISKFVSQEFKPHSVELIGERVFVADMGTAQTVHEFNTDGAFIKSWDRPVANFLPSSISLIDQNTIAAVNPNAWTIHLFDLEGKQSKVLDYDGQGPGKIHNVSDVESDGKGFIYASEWAGSKIHKMAFDAFMSGCHNQGECP